MALPQDLLEQAQFLVHREQRKPKQATLRRAVSTAYYAAFHLLVSAAAHQASPALPAGLRQKVQRSLEHGTMKEAAKRFESRNLPDPIKHLLSSSLSGDLVAVARNFVRLQQERHDADYDLAARFDRPRAQDAVRLAVQLFSHWNAVRDSEDASVFLASLIFWRLWSK